MWSPAPEPYAVICVYLVFVLPYFAQPLMGRKHDTENHEEPWVNPLDLDDQESSYVKRPLRWADVPRNLEKNEDLL